VEIDTAPLAIASSTVFGQASARLVMTNAYALRKNHAISSAFSCPVQMMREATPRSFASCFIFAA
jgi:hypothetical protein